MKPHLAFDFPLKASSTSFSPLSTRTPRQIYGLKPKTESNRRNKLNLRRLTIQDFAMPSVMRDTSFSPKRRKNLTWATRRYRKYDLFTIKGTSVQPFKPHESILEENLPLMNAPYQTRKFLTL